MHQLSRKEVHAYWSEPPHTNRAKRYIGRPGYRTIIALADQYVAKDAALLELGCNVGTTMDALRLAGYSNLTGIEINPEAVALLHQLYGDLGTILTGPIEQHLPKLGAFDMIYSKAVLCHVHTDSDGIFAQMAERTRFILTVEDEQTRSSGRHFPRNYRLVLKQFGFRQVEYIHEPEGMGAPYVARLLRRD